MIYKDYNDLSKDVIPSLNEYIDVHIEKYSLQPCLTKAMKYSIDSGGKRIRPLLLLSTFYTFSDDLPLEHLFAAAGALELVHTYSLIHDDLPAMDNSSVRRGKPSNHKVFGEAEAILVGDALLSLSFEWLSNMSFPTPTVTRLINILSHEIGPSGMVAGQMKEIVHKNEQLCIDDILDLDIKKTSSLILASVQMGAALADVPFRQQSILEKFANDFGLAFQIKDDIDDFCNDSKNIKNTIPSLIGIDNSKKKIRSLVLDAKKQLDNISEDTSLLESFLNYFKDEMV